MSRRIDLFKLARNVVLEDQRAVKVTIADVPAISASLHGSQDATHPNIGPTIPFSFKSCFVSFTSRGKLLTGTQTSVL